MKLPRYTATTPPPRSSGLARAGDIGALTRTGEQAKLRGIGAIGGAIGKIGELIFASRMKRKGLDDSRHWGDATQKTNEAAADLAKRVRDTNFEVDEPLPDSPDYFKSKPQLSLEQRDRNVVENMAEFDDITGQIAQSFTDLDEKAKFTEWADARRLQVEASIEHEWNAKHGDYARRDIVQLMTAAAQNGNLEIANAYADVMDKYELITAERTLAYKQENERIMQAAKEKALLASYQSQGFALAATEGYEAALEWISSPARRGELVKAGLSAEKQETFISILRSSIRAEETKQQQVQAQKDDVTGNEFLDLLINKLDPTKQQLTFEQISESDMSLEAKEGWLTKLRVFDNFSKTKLEEAFQDKGSVLADVYEGIEDNTITDEEVRDLVGKGLSPTTAQTIIKERETQRQPQYRETEQLFKRLFGWSPQIGFPNELAGAFYEKVLRDWHEQITERKVVGSEITDLGREIARPYFIKHLKQSMPPPSDIPAIVELALGEPEEVEKREKEEEAKETPPTQKEPPGVLTTERAGALADEFMGKLPPAPPENPYKKEYPDAFFEGGIWKVIRDGKKYRIED